MSSTLRSPTISPFYPCLPRTLSLPNGIAPSYDEVDERPSTSDCKVRVARDVFGVGGDEVVPGKARETDGERMMPLQVITQEPGVSGLRSALNSPEYDEDDVFDTVRIQTVLDLNEHLDKEGETLSNIPEYTIVDLFPVEPVEVVCAGDLHLEQIVSGTGPDRPGTARDLGTEAMSISASNSTTTATPNCWIHQRLCPGETTVFQWVTRKIRSFVTCSPIRKFVRCCCLYNDSENSSNAERSASFELEMVQYMKRHQGFLNEFLLNSMEFEVIERLYLLKVELEQGKPLDSQSVQGVFRAGQREFKRVMSDIDDNDEDTMILKLTKSILAALSGTVFRMYKVFPEDDETFIEVYTMEHGNPDTAHWEPTTEVESQCLEALRRRSILIFTRLNDPLIFDENCQSSNTLFIRNDEAIVPLTNQVLVPVYGEQGEVIYLMEIWRSNTFFSCPELETALAYCVWGSVAFIYFVKFINQRRQNELNKFLLDSVKSTFEDVMSIDQVVKHTLQYAQKLVDADRASLFMVDRDNQELVSRVFDLRGDGSDARQPEEIRIPMARGIAGHVASTGETVNIANAYADERFNDEVDEATGYCTTSILCMPVKVDRKVIGVVQMVNKRNGSRFSSDDESSFNIFSAFFGLALHNAGIYDMIARNEQKYRVALDVLSYHNTCREYEMHELQQLQPLPPEVDLDNFYLDPFKFDPLEKCQAVMIMFNDLFSLKNFDHNSLTRFVLTVKKNYREVPYHNFHHGWSVAQSMYAILKADTVSRFNYKQRLALFVASLCHDLDHRGYTNKYMSETASPLASMYTTSTLEHHHFGITVTILQQDGHNIFDRFNSEEYKEMLGLIKTCILATDLAAFFPNLAQLEIECKGNYDWGNNEHSKLAMALSMTAADLSAAAKPWDIQIETVKVIFQEFYDQGDKERKAGRKPIPMMDRDKPQEQPASQVGFITSICLPCYGMLQYLLPKTDKMLSMAERNLEIWQSKATEVDLAKAAEGSSLSSPDESRTANLLMEVQQALEEIKDKNEYSMSKDSSDDEVCTDV